VLLASLPLKEKRAENGVFSWPVERGRADFDPFCKILAV